MPDTPPPDQSSSSKPSDGFAPAIEAAKAAKRLQDTADTLKQQASLIKDPAERERLIRAAYDKEVQAHGQSKKARAMASGWGQGAAAGVGIASAVGMGLGNLVGVLLSGVTAVPGVLVGSGVGAAHGPWFKLGGKKDDDKKDDGKETEEKSTEEDSDDEEAHRAIVEAARQAEAEEEGSGKAEKDTQPGPPQSA
ncbi:hypothetical protein CONLIGDRAFT_686478 [Coniochaeta ligniaria NRRL 30616]|uniref:Uncharacterized protein n=1 Tax=Coniochaeta ligniaria NRRL 30616 TaxID=1408157 RepID=A0A1J7I7T5_9PEZI|nr:hypothetical protein CONLIGDRAFT_686478 [Coniochaeta ligniaria NRRL 30616]